MEKTQVSGTYELNEGFTKLYGCSVQSESDVEVEFFDGDAIEPFMFLNVLAGTSVQQWFEEPIVLYGGLRIEADGTIEGVIWWQGYQDVDGGVEYPIRDNTRGATAI